MHLCTKVLEGLAAKYIVAEYSVSDLEVITVQVLEEKKCMDLEVMATVDALEEKFAGMTRCLESWTEPAEGNFGENVMVLSPSKSNLVENNNTVTAVEGNAKLQTTRVGKEVEHKPWGDVAEEECEAYLDGWEDEEAQPNPKLMRLLVEGDDKIGSNVPLLLYLSRRKNNRQNFVESEGEQATRESFGSGGTWDFHPSYLF